MPCRDGGPTEFEVRQAQKARQERLDMLTQFLCSVSQYAEDNDLNDILNITAENGTLLRMWWTEHQAVDEARKAAEDRAKRDKRAALKEQAKKIKAQLKELDNG